MSMDKIFEEYKKPKISYSEFKEKNYNNLYKFNNTKKMRIHNKLKLCIGVIIIIFVFSLGFIVRGGNRNEKINISFIINGESYSVELDKGASISKKMIPLINKNENIELYYDKNMQNEYNFENLEEDTVIYIKFVEKELEQIILDNSYLIGIHTIVVSESVYSSSLKFISNDNIKIFFDAFFYGKKFTNDKERVEYVFENSFNNNHYSFTFNGETPFSIDILNDGTMILFINEKDFYVSEQDNNIDMNLFKEKLKLIK